jgi:hypothetical protein
MPEAVRRRGAAASISISAKSATGAAEGSVIFMPDLVVIGATLETNPSTLAAVGNEINGLLYLWAITRVIS